MKTRAHLRSVRASQGQVIVLFVLGVTALILIAGLAVDGGNAFLNRRTAQNTSDLAALAGTKAVAEYYTSTPAMSAAAAGAAVYNNVLARAADNDCTGTGAVPCSWTAEYVDGNQTPLGPVAATAAVPANAQGVLVKVVRTPSTFLLGIIGQGHWNVGTEAIALAGKPNPRGGVILPIALQPPTNLKYGEGVTLTEASTYGPGNFAWLSWTGANAAGVLADSICVPDNPALTLPTPVPGDPGVTNSSQVRDCLSQWIGAIVLIPVFDTCTDCNGNNAEFNIIGYAAFQLTGFTTSGGAINTLTGDFVEYYPGGIGALPSPGDTTVNITLVR